jgi:uncharacterized membrane protein YeaQ/YmgE (transglycosylase-associated protein family)
MTTVKNESDLRFVLFYGGIVFSLLLFIIGCCFVGVYIANYFSFSENGRMGIRFVIAIIPNVLLLIYFLKIRLR